MGVLFLFLVIFSGISRCVLFIVIFNHLKILYIKIIYLMITKSTFIGQHIDDVTKRYKFLKELGSGSYGSVYRVQDKSTGRIYACKKMNKKGIKNKERFKTEIDLLKATDHSNIVRLYDIYEDTSYLYLIMEECLGGEFFDRISQRAQQLNFYSEKEAAGIFRQIVSCINYLHSHGVAHRDLKPENILFASLEEESPVKVIDFGLSKVFNNEHKMKSIVGTTFYMAPEVFKGCYDRECDIWSAGVILYIMLCGRPPFYARTEKEIIRKIVHKDYNFNSPEWKNISEQAKELISRIFVDAEIRLTASQILEDDWTKNNAPLSKDEILNIEWSHMNNYARLNKLQKSVINFTVFHLKDEETKKITKIFKSLDVNSDGVLSSKEIKFGIDLLKTKKILDIKAEEVDKVFEEVDVDKNKLINYTEFISSIYEYESRVTPEHVHQAFESFDKDGNGKLTLKELKEIIKPQTQADLDYLVDLIKKYDKNGDGAIDLKEFLEGLEFWKEDEEMNGVMNGSVD